MDVTASQGSSLLSVDLSGSDVTDSGLVYLKDCNNLQCLNFNYCDQISDYGLEQIHGNYFFVAWIRSKIAVKSVLCGQNQKILSV